MRLQQPEDVGVETSRHLTAGMSRSEHNYVRFAVSTAVTMKNTVFWDVAPCRYFVNRRFGETYRLHLQGIRNPRAIRSSETSVNKISTRRHITEDGILQNTIMFGTILRRHYSNFMIERLRKDGGEEGNAKGEGVKTSTEGS
jgi:hypothetical protein